MRDNKGGCAVALGTFDGLHIGHNILLNTLKENANGRLTMVCTFKNIPASYFGAEVKQLFTPEEKSEMISKAGIDVLFMRSFDKSFAETDRDAYISELIDKIGCSLIVVGYNYRFGKGRNGDAEYLMEEAAKKGVKVIIVPEVEVDGEQVSSTRIREYITSGMVDKAKKLLGRNYTVKGKVVEGKQLGRTIGFPTANIEVAKEKCIPGNGVYATIAEIDGERYVGMTNIGVRPTVDNDGEISIETYMDGFDRDIYGRDLKLEFVEKIRDEVKMSDVNALKCQLNADLEKAKILVKKA